MPADNSIEVSVYSYGVKAESAAHLIIRNITIRHQETAGVYIFGNKTDNLLIENCLFENIYLYGIMGANKNALTVRQNTLRDIWDGAIFIGGMTNVDINHNSFYRIGIQAPGRATDDLISYRCIDMNHSSGIISNNIIDSVGFSGIVFFRNTIVERNRVSHFCMSIDDGSGIGTHGVSDGVKNGTNCFIRNNIISDAAGTAESFPLRTDPFVNGIFMDDNSGNAFIENNSIYNIQGKGIFIHNSSYNQIRNNTIFNCTGGALVMEHDYSGEIPQGNIANDNIFYNIGATENSLKIANWHSSELGLNFGTFSGNYYINPYNDAAIYTAGYGKNHLGQTDLVQNEFTVRGWRETRDATAKSRPVRLTDYKIISINSTNLVANGNFDSGKDGWSCYADNNSCSIEWKNNGELDGGYLQVSSPWFPYGNFFNTRHVTLEKAKQYLLSYSIVGKYNKLSAFNIVDRNEKYAELSPKTKHEVASKRLEHQLLITPRASTSAGQLSFYLGPELVPEFSIDNIILEEVNTIPINPLTENLFYVNSSAVEQTIELPGPCLDIDSNLISGKIKLSPYSSKIFIKTEQSIVPLSILSLSAHALNDESSLIECEINSTNNLCTIELEKSTNGVTFKTITSFDQSTQNFFYHFTDREFYQTSFYRIKTHCIGEVPVYSRIVKLENRSSTGRKSLIQPNIISSRVLTIINEDNFTDAAMFGSDGRKVFRFTVKEGKNSVVLPSHIGRGLYFLRLSGVRQSKTFQIIKE